MRIIGSSNLGRAICIAISFLILLTLPIGCRVQALPPDGSAASETAGTAEQAFSKSAGQGTEGATEANLVDQRSYRLGGIGAFAEMVGAGVKRLALSAAMTAAEMDALIDEAGAIAERNGAEIYLEKDFLVTDLFPAEITEGMQVLLIYRGRTLQEYADLKERKRLLVESDSYEGAAREEVAREMGKLLSYPEDKIMSLLSRPQDESS